MTKEEAVELGFIETKHRPWPDSKKLLIKELRGFHDLFFDRDGTLIYLTTLHPNKTK